MSSNTASTFKPRHVHFVGSVPLPATEDVFQCLTTTFPNQLQRIPDGETGKRQGFILWQTGILEGSNIRIMTFTAADREPQIPSTRSPAANIAPSYDDFALDSYKTFCHLRDQGVIPHGIRFQVSLPTPANVICCIVHPEDQVRAEPLYEAALLSCLRRIQNSIPAHDLAIQWDLAAEFALLEFSQLDPQPNWKPRFISSPWFSPLKEGLIERIVRLAGHVDSGVEMGFHLCYGDARHQHFIQPKDTALLVEMANLISSAVKRDISWVHMPVPIDRKDEAYFTPLKELKLKPETELFLGLVHADGKEKTEERIAVAGKFVNREFGVTTECGMGRTGSEEFEKVMDVMAAVTGAS
ncbi:hypothetical protein ONS95_013415 [Cadophora gregata]|uniref:uncharacterized protein n=1 Tax=Cadophora gregata TaxID=51156 RepID=UPI0026DB6617|nr:uncharacterized protein ONS95_013415 [Cadophora gregata]KAK0099692.1 hypothetical protein ONS96_008189 [Cadophora gregata f. sp. sojae]KAK0116395.1 hypothetical protein ONS95_013415 [Cadophora gregata]